jgi:quinol monooxygenase YgiN
VRNRRGLAVGLSGAGAWHTAWMLVVSRFRYPDGEVEQTVAELSSCVELLSRLPGFVSGTVGRALDDPTLWLLTTTWRDVGSYRRALSSYDAKVQVVPLLSRAIDEPSAYEALAGVGAEAAMEPNVVKPRGAG